MFNEELVKKVFYDIVEDAKYGNTVNIDEIYYVRFNYYENNKIYKDTIDEKYIGNDNSYNEEYEYEDSNGSLNYIPTLKVNNIDLFIKLINYICYKYNEIYNFDKFIKKYGEYTCIKNVLLTILSNARYVDYEKPIEYLYKVIAFLEDKTLDNYYLISNEIECLNNSKIILESNKDDFGYETTKIFNISLNKEDNKYNLPSINYAIKDNVCYIYSIQNKNKNIDNEYTKYIKRKLYKINKNVSDSRDYDNEENILSPTPSFVLALSIFLNILKNNGINLIRFITFMPDRYFEKIGSDFDVTKIQYNLTQKLYYLIERIKYHYNIDINYPIFENINLYNIEDVGDDIVIDISNLVISNNEFLNNIVNSISKDKINKIM